MTRPEKRREIMQAAEKLFAGRRFHEITLDQVACQARVGKGTIYRYFKDKEDLFFQTAMDGLDHMRDLLLEQVPREAPFGQQLLLMCSEIGRFYRKRGRLFHMIHHHEGRLRAREQEMRHKWWERRMELVGAATEILERGVKQGSLRSDIPADQLARFLLGMLRTRWREYMHHPELKPSLQTVVDLFLQGARPQGPAE